MRGRLVVKPNALVTVRDLMECGIISNAREGVKILAHVRNCVERKVLLYLPVCLIYIQGKERFDKPIHLEVSSASSSAIGAVEAAGGTITCAHFNRLALRALLKPYKFDMLPRRARPQPKQMAYYMDHTKCGYLSPEVQVRNLELFGHVTSEAAMRKEHGMFMKTKWAIAREKREAMGIFMPPTTLLQDEQLFWCGVVHSLCTWGDQTVY